MFVAKKKDGRFISLLDRRSKDELIQLKKDYEFYCTACHHPVQLKLGAKRLPHFAHFKDSNCSSQAEHETPYHMEGKKQLYWWFLNQNYDVEIEPYINEIKQRPDLLIKIDGQPFAIEFQCSQLSYEHLLKRTNAYKRIKIHPIWILGESWLKSSETPLFFLSQFQWLFTTKIQSKYPNCLPTFILYFNPTTKKFTKISNLIPFTPTKSFATIQTYSQNSNQLIDILTSFQPIHPQMINLWLEKKNKWRYQFTMYPDRKLKPLFLAMYLAKIPRESAPAEVGLPFQTVYLIETSAVIWQLWILLDSIIPVSCQETISFDDTYQMFKKRVDEGHIKIRTLPNVEGQHYSFAIMDYLQLLSKLGILKRKDSRYFVKVKEINIPRNRAEATDLDKAVLKKLYVW